MFRVHRKSHGVSPRPTEAYGASVDTARADPATTYHRWLPAGISATTGTPGRRTTRDWLVDILLFGLAIGVGLLATDPAGAGQPTWWHVANLAIGGAACLSLWWRRRWPCALGIALVPVAMVVPMGSGAAGVALFTVAVHRPVRWAIGLALAHVAISPVYLLLYPDDELPAWISLALGALMTGAMVAWGMFVRTRRQLLVSLAERVERAEAEQALQSQRARLAERERIAREMHDVLAHRLSLLSLHAGTLEYRPDLPAQDVARAAGVIRDNAHRALEELRLVIGALRQDDEGARPAPPQPTLADLPRLVDESRAAGMRVALAQSLDRPGQLPADIGRHAYRVVQEGLTNARKHAPHCAVTVRIDGAPGGGLRVEITNPLPVGQTPPDIPGARAGLSGLDERVRLAGGALEHSIDTGGVHRLAASFPWAQG